ncbi:MAG: secretin N-terminal domain-containing protein, partial [Candidatus Rokuibacteriota bacterium]
VPGAPGVPATAEPAERPPLVLADKRTNVLVVSARRADLELISQLVSQLDVDTQANKRVFVYYVENVKAKELAVTLTEIFGKPGEGATRPERRDLAAEAPGYTGAPPRAPAPAPPTGTPAAPPVLALGTEVEPGVVEGQVKVVADEPNNALIVTTFPRNWPLIEDTIRKLDRTPKQVLIEVLVVEITLDDDNRLGLEWTLRTQQNVKLGGQTYNVGGVSRLDVGPPAPALTTPTIPGFPFTLPAVSGLSFFIFETDRFLGLLNLYANYDKLNVLSSPHILTSENKKAVINVSDSVPIVTQQTVSQTGTVTTQAQETPSNVLSQSVEYRDAGIILTVTPRISDKRVVALDVKQTVNNVGAAQAPSGSPIIIKREAETSVVLHDNQTLVLGGLIQTRRASVRTGIPGLSRIPILGFLFGVTSERLQRTELLILITPRVIGDPTEARNLYEQIRGQRPDLQRSLETHPTILRPNPAEPNEPPARAPREPAPSAPATPGGPSER